MIKKLLPHFFLVLIHFSVYFKTKRIKKYKISIGDFLLKFQNVLEDTKSNLGIRKLVFFSILFFSFSFANAENRFSVASGNWNSTAVWSLTSDGAPGASAPVAGDNVIIQKGLTVTSVGTVSINSIVINAGSTLNLNSRILNVSSFFTNNGTVTGTSGQVNLATGDFTNATSGTITLTTGQVSVSIGSFSSIGSFVFSAKVFLKLGGNFSYLGVFDLGSAQVQFIGNANQSIQGFTTTGVVSLLKTGGTAILTGNVNGGGLTISNGTNKVLDPAGTLNLISGIHTFSGKWTRTVGTLNCGSSLLRIGLNIAGTGGVFNAGTGTVEYYRAGGQAAAVVVYNNLILSGSGNKTFATSPTVNGKLTLAEIAKVMVTNGAITYGPKATLQYDVTNNRIVTSKEWVTPFMASGGVIINSINNLTLNEAKVFGLNSPLYITNIGKLITGNNGLTFGGDFINQDGAFTSTGPIVITDTMATQSIAGLTTTGLVSMTKTYGTATFVGDVNSAGLTVNGIGGTLNLGSSLTHTVTGAVTLTNGTLNGDSSTLNVNGAGSVWMGTGNKFIGGTGTVNFGGAAQTLATTSTFNNLTFSNLGIKTLTGVPIVNDTLSMEGTATVSTAPNYGAAATLQYNRSVDQVAGSEWISPFVAAGGVSFIGSGIITADATKFFNATAPLNIEDGATLDNGGFAISGSSTLTVVDDGKLQLSGTSTFPVFTATTLGDKSAVIYSGTAQYVAIQNYGDLLLSGSGNKTFAGVTTIAGDLEISDTAKALLFNNTTSSARTLILDDVLQTTKGSYGGAGSTATTKSATWFGTTTTGVLNVTSSCLPGTWLGLMDDDWNNKENWCGGNVPTALMNVTIGNTVNQPVISASGAICSSITIRNGATLTVSGSNTLTVVGNWTNNGNFASDTSTVIFNGTAAQTIGGTSVTTFNNLTNANTKAIVYTTNAIAVKNNLNIASSTSVLDMGTYALTDGGNFSNTGIGKFKTANISVAPIPVNKIWKNTVIYSNTTGGQIIVAGTYNGTPSLELGNTSGTQTASGSIVTDGQLNINSGGAPVFDLNGYNLTANKLNITAPNSVLDMRGGSLSYTSVLSMQGTVRYSGVTNGKPFTSGTVEYYGTTQTVTAGNYNNLLFSGTTGIYTMASDLDVANTLKVTNGSVTLKVGYNLSVGDAVTVVSPGTLTIENNASLLQTDYTGPNSGNVIVKRNTTPVLKYDATFWSSPTTGTQTLYNFSPGTDWDRYNGYDSTMDQYTYPDATTTVFGKGIGYSIRCPSTTSSTVAKVLPYQFIGVPNNGTFTTPLAVALDGSGGLSLVGNPYPSALNAEDFITENLYDPLLNPTNTLSGTYYIWTHNNRLVGNDFIASDYYTCNQFGSTGTAAIAGSGNPNEPTGFIASGQGFFVENVVAGNLKFNNSMREIKNNTNFYRTKNIKKVNDLERHRVWLDFTNSAMTTGSQTLLGYAENASNDFDYGYDSYLFDDAGPLLIYSMLGIDAMAIQARASPFSDLDTIPLGYYTKVADNLTVTINRVDGLFLDNQDIYLEDKLLNVIHDLKEEPYTFASDAGTFDNRFMLRYRDRTLGNVDFDNADNQVFISKDKNELKVKSEIERIKRVTVFDLSGKKVFENNVVDNNEFRVSTLILSNQIGIVKLTLENGQVISKKVSF